MELLLTAIILGEIGLFIWREHLSFIERRELVDRLMAKTLPEYKDNLTTEPNHLEETPTDQVDLDEGRDELTYGNQEAN